MTTRSSTTGQGALREREAVRWAVVTCLIAAAVGTVAYSVGATGGGEPADAAAAGPEGAPELISLTGLYHHARRQGFADGKRSAYAEGRLDGMEEGRRAERRRLERTRGRIEARAAEDALDGLDQGGWFLVTLGEDGRSIGERAGPLAPGLNYALCRAAAAVCSTSRGR
jgi:hypothetical protein